MKATATFYCYCFFVIVLVFVIFFVIFIVFVIVFVIVNAGHHLVLPVIVESRVPVDLV